MAWHDMALYVASSLHIQCQYILIIYTAYIERMSTKKNPNDIHIDFGSCKTFPQQCVERRGKGMKHFINKWTTRREKKNTLSHSLRIAQRAHGMRNIYHFIISSKQCVHWYKQNASTRKHQRRRVYKCYMFKLFESFSMQHSFFSRLQIVYLIWAYFTKI